MKLREANTSFVVCCVKYFELFPGVWCLITDVSEHCVCSIFIGLALPAVLNMLYMFWVLFAPIISSKTVAYSHRLLYGLVCYPIGAGTGLGHLYTLARSVTD
jgi:hypothetical protein